MGELAEFERELIRARTGEGRKRAQERGVRFGRPRKLTPPQRQEALARLEHSEGDVVFRHACKMGLEGIVSKRLGSRYRSGRSPDWLKFKNPNAPAVKREAEEDWAR